MLVQVLREHDNEGARTMASVLLRQVMTQSGVWAQMNDEARHLASTGLLDALQADPVEHVRRRIAHTIAQTAVQVTTPVDPSKPPVPLDRAWPELLPATLRLASPGAPPSQRQAGLFLLSRECECLGPEMQQFAKDVYETCRDCVEGDAPPALAHAASQAITGLLYHLEDDASRNAFQPLMEPLIHVVGRLLRAMCEMEAGECLSDLQVLAQSTPLLFRPILRTVVDVMRSIVESSSLETQTRAAALELLVTLVQNGSGMIRHEGSFVPLVVPMIVQCMVEIEGDSEWESGAYQVEDDPSGDEEADAISVVAEEALGRVALALGPASTVPCVMETIRPLVREDAAWQHQRAGIAALEVLVVSVGSKTKAFAPEERIQLLDMLVPFLRDDRAAPNMRVRHAALGCAASMVQTFGGLKHSQFVEQVAPQLFPVLARQVRADSGNCPRVCAHAATAITTVCQPDQCPASLVSTSADELLEGLLSLLQCGQDSVVAAALSATANVARCCSESFVRFYDAFMPGVKGLMESAGASAASSEDARGWAAAGMVRGKAIECLALMGEAVGREVFERDAREVLEYFLRGAGAAAVLRGDDPAAPAIAEACARIAGVLGDAFVPYLDVVIPPLLEMAAQEVAMSVEEVEEGGMPSVAAGGYSNAAAASAQEGEMSSMLCDVRGLGSQLRVSMNTTQMEQKQLATRLLMAYADALEGALGPHVPRIAETVVPLVGFNLYAPVRGSAASALPKLLESGFAHMHQTGSSPGEMTPFVEGSLHALMEQLTKEKDIDAACNEAEAIEDIFIACLNGAEEGSFEDTRSPALPLPRRLVDPVVHALIGTAEASLHRRQRAVEERQEKDEMDEEVWEALHEELEGEEELMRHVIDSLGYLIKNIQADALPVFERSVRPLLQPLLVEAEVPNVLRHNALCTFVDVVEWCGEGATGHLQALWNPMLTAATDEDEELRQVACYGIGIVAERYPALVRGMAREVVGVLTRAMDVPNAYDEDNVHATENAVSALGKVLHNALHEDFGPLSESDVQKLWGLWLSRMPLREDEIEARVSHRLLCEQARGGNHAIMTGEGPGHVVRVGAQVLAACGGGGGNDGAELATVDTQRQLAQLVQCFQRARGATSARAAWEALEDAEKAAVQEAIAEL